MERGDSSGGRRQCEAHRLLQAATFRHVIDSSEFEISEKHARRPAHRSRKYPSLGPPLVHLRLGAALLPRCGSVANLPQIADHARAAFSVAKGGEASLCCRFTTVVEGRHRPLWVT